ncbi:MAG: hypothetical protein AAB420_04195 [Patescibacteria group bacterium]
MKKERRLDTVVSEKHAKKQELLETRKYREALMSSTEELKKFLHPVRDRLAMIKIQEGPLSSLVIERARALEEDLQRDYKEVRKKIDALSRTEQITWPETARHTFYDKGSNRFVVESTHGELISCTVGQLEASIVWEVEYAFDYRTSSNIQLEIFLLQTLRRFAQKWERICSLIETTNWHNLGGASLKADAYDELFEKLGTSPDQSTSGSLAERMALSLLTQISNDDDGMDITPVHAPAEYDVEKKIDIVIGNKASELFGIQFVSTTNPEVLMMKEKQLRIVRANMAADPLSRVKFKSIFLVAVEMSGVDLHLLYRDWYSRRGDLVGGPEQLLSSTMKREIIMKSFTPVVGAERAAEAVQNIAIP